VAVKPTILAALLACVAGPAVAQTAIVPDTVAVATTGTTATPLGTTTVIDGGTRVGNNLFHSFASFSLATGDMALWARAANDGATIANIVNRVTGGAPSTIDGTLATQGMPNASYWFINPAGIVFGANAAVAVPNAAYFSTAGVLRFADGGTFAVTTPGGSVLSVAAPAAFGFLGGQGNISLTGAQPAFVSPDTQLSLSAANISITGSTFTAGALDFAAVGTGIGNVSVVDPAAIRFGNGRMALTDSFVTAEPGATRAGAIRATASRLDVTRSTFASDSNARSAAGLQLRVGDLRVTAPVATGAPLAYLGSFAADAGDAGPVSIVADSILLSGSSQISTQALDTATGNAGNIGITTGALTIDGGASILSSAFGNSATGEVRIDTGALIVRSGGSIESTTYGAGRGGDILINASTMTIDGGRIALEAEQGSSGDAGTVNIGVSGAVALTNGGIITSSSLGSGYAGYVGLIGDTITLQGRSSIQSDSFGPDGAGAGEMDINARILRIESGSEISSATEGAGFGGLLKIHADRIAIDNAAINSSSFGGSGTAGIIVVQTDDLSIANNGEITSSTTGAGNAGLVSILTKNLLLQTSGQISTETFGAGRAGDIEIDATGIAIASTGRIISAQTGAAASGDAGRITIVTNSLAVAPATATAISTSIDNGGQAGEIDITAKSILLNGGEIGSAAKGSTAGRSGIIDIRTDSFTIANGGRVETSSFSPQAAGGIAIDAGVLTLEGVGAEITSENLSASGGAAGSILISADSLRVVDGAGISTDSATGAAGDITIDMPPTSTLLLKSRGGPASFITTSSGPGTGGIITIASPYLILSDGGSILALGQAFGADVLISSNFYIRSADRSNALSVDGSLIVDSEIGDLSTGSESVDLSFLDASSVLRGQCAAARTGGVSQLSTRITGPYVPFTRPAPTRPSISFNTRFQPRCG
jgi:filamentous hemagglutinin family protein